MPNSHKTHWAIAVSVLVMAVTIWFALVIGSLIDLREAVFADPNAGKIVVLGVPPDQRTTPWTTWMLDEGLASQLSPVEHWLAAQRPGFLWASLYGLAGLAGGILHLWLLVIEPVIFRGEGRRIDNEFEWGRFVLRILVSAAAGVLSYFVLLLPAEAAVTVFKLPTFGKTIPLGGVLDRLILFPVAVGIFVDIFFARLREWLKDFLKGKKK